MGIGERVEKEKFIKVLKGLVAVATEKMEHLWTGGCPQYGEESRNKKCPACNWIIAAEKLIKEMKGK